MNNDSGNGSPRVSRAGRLLRSSRFRRHPCWTAAAIRLRDSALVEPERMGGLAKAYLGVSVMAINFKIAR